MTLRVMAKVRGESVDKKEVARLLRCPSDQEKLRHWSLDAPATAEADLDSQVDFILSRVTGDLSVWKKITEEYRVDLFCGLLLERSNRGVTLAPKTMTELGTRGIQIGFDIYAPETEPNQALEPTSTAVTPPASASGVLRRDEDAGDRASGTRGSP